MPKGYFTKNATAEQKLDDLRNRLIGLGEPIPFSGCIIFMGFLHKEGYGLITYLDKSVLAHRASYIANVGPIAEGQVIMHKCDVKSCINPDHLVAGTQTDNMRDMISKGRARYMKGDRHKNAKLTADCVRAIRSSDHPSTILADQYGISARSVRDVRLNKTWKHVS